MQASTFRALLAAWAIATASAAGATDIFANGEVIPAPDIDSGLGELPHYTKWQEPWLYAVPAEKRDSGLGELPHYTKWQEPWLYAVPAEKLDSGLGELPHYTKWQEPWLDAVSAEKLDSGLLPNGERAR